ncbi:hypothetical protein CQA57_01445 [Helicobacter anseris]|uniref:Autotransporter domain-containing protein n=1 Tax=Helicobacter anseris TaxID=375926 RepID=A0A3D8JA66_9HELI|nr:hypothetical protein [Helicobacter anseris]RDU74403.1 hypothetical protein CQA57_01445 [Helicobacter anseris]
MGKRQLSFIFNVKHSFVALSIAGLLCPVSSFGQQESITNDNDADKKQTIGTATGGETLSGSIKTSGNNSNTTVDFRGNSSMQNGQISATTTNGTGTNTGATNTITLQENSVLNLTASTNGNAQTDPAYSILASGVNAKNTISDITTGTATGSIKGVIFAQKEGVNIINNLRNTAISGAIIADGKGSQNTLSFDRGTTLSGYIAALNKGINIITLNNGAKLSITTSVEQTEGASILADSEGSSNTIKGTTEEKNTIQKNVVAKDKGSNTIDLKNLEVSGDIKAVNGGSNTVTIEQGFLTNITTTGADSTNTINLNGTASIKGYISNLETNGANGTNTIILNQESTLNLTKGSNTDSAAIFSSNGSNTISGNSTGNHKITGNISAKNNGKNTITLEKLTMTGDVTTDSGNNTITLGKFGSTDKSTITGNIEAKNGGKNILDFTNVTITGSIIASGTNGKNSENIVTLKDSSVGGNITAESQGKNTLVLGNGGTKADITGYIKAQANGSNSIEFNNGNVEGGIFAEGANASNTITLGNKTFTGIIKSNITATNGGKNTIDIQSVEMTGSISAEKNGQNEITDNNPFDKQSTITGSIAAKDNGTNTIMLKNIAITQGITAGGTGAKNTITLGGKENGIITTNIIANAQGTNDITFTNHTSLIGNITAEKNGNNTIKEKNDSATRTLVTGSIIADGGKNTVDLANTTITQGILAQNAGTNTITIKTTDTTKSLISNITAQSGGTNTITMGENTTSSGILEGSLSASDNGSKNEVTMNNNSILRNGSITANASNNTGAETSTNTLTLNNTSSIALQSDAYAIYATGVNASNSITGGTTGNNSIQGDIVADSGSNHQDTKTGAKNTITLNNLTITGEISAYNAGNNKLDLKTADITGNFQAQSHGENTVDFQNNAQASVSGSFIARDAGRNVLTLNNGANVSIASNNNTNAFQAVGTDATNTFKEINTTTNTSGSITGNIYAENKGKNEIQVQALQITGDVISYDGTNTITLGSTNTSGITGNILADSSNAQGAADSINTINLNNNANISGYIASQGTNTEKKATNAITLNNNAILQLAGGRITDSNGDQIGTGNDAIFSETLQAYNKIKDESSGNTQSTINGNIYAKDSTQDASQKGGNNITLKNVAISGDIFADTSGVNVLTLGATGKNSTISGNIFANDKGRNKLTLTNTNIDSNSGYIKASAGNASSRETSNTIILNETSSITNTYIEASQESQTQNNTISETKNIITLNNTSSISLVGDAKNNAITASGYNTSNSITCSSTATNQISGNILANQMGQNTINITTLKINENTTGNITASSNQDNTIETSNTITLGNNSTIHNTFILAKQEARTGTNISNTINTITLSGNASINLISNNDSNAILADGVSAKNTITDNGTGTHTIIGNIKGDYDGKNTITLKHISMTGDIIADNSGGNTITFGNNGTDNSFYGNISALTKFSSSVNTINFSGAKIGGEEIKYILADSNSDNGGKNTITLNNTSSISNMYIIAQGGGSTNTINFSDTNSSLSLVADLQTGFAIHATGNNAKNIIANGANATNQANHIINGILQADNSGSNNISLYQLTMNGDIIAQSSGSNTLNFGNTNNGKTSTFTGNINAQDGKNTLNATNATLSGNLQALASSEASNTITINGASNFNSGSIVARTQNNGEMREGEVSDGADDGNNNEGGGEVTPPVVTPLSTAVNTITLNGTSSLTLQSQDNIIILADGKGASNTIDDKTTNAQKSNIIGNILARSGQNTITLKHVSMQGDILANEEGKNTISFGENQNGNSLKGNIVANNATNVVTLKSADMTGSIQALVDSSTNTLTLASSTLNDGYMVAISNEKAASNTLSIDVDSTMKLKGAQIINADGQKVGSGNDAIFTQGAQSINKIEDKSSNQHTINGNITADSGGKNNYTFNKIQITGSIRSTNTDASNTIGIKDSSSIANGVILAQGSGVSNALTFSDSSTLTNSYLQAIVENNTIAPQEETDTPATQNTNATNALTFEGTSTFNLASDSNGISIFANGDGASNTISGNKGSVNGNIIAKDGGVNTLDKVSNLSITATLIGASENSAKNTIKITNNGTNITANALKVTAGVDGIAILADNGNNTIDITQGGHSITGNIVANNGGSNILTYNNDSINNTTPNATPQNNQMLITGNIIANNPDSKNTLTLQGYSSIKASMIQATDGGQNTISIKENSQNTVFGSISIKNANQDALIASGFDSKNTLYSKSNTANVIEGNIIASNGGSNIVEQIDLLNLTDGYISANGDLSTNSIVLSDFSTMALIANNDKNAIYANKNDAINKITDNGKSYKNSTITGNITSDNGGKNEISLIGLDITGNLSANNSGSNTISIGGTLKTIQNGNNTPIKAGFTGAIFANGADSKNSITFNKDAEALITKDESGNNAILANGDGASNIIKDSSSGKILKISGDITAKNAGKNTIEFDKASMSGNVIAQSGGSNAINLTKGNITETQSIISQGGNSLNALNYNDFSFTNLIEQKDHFFISAKDGAENRLFLTLAQNGQNTTDTLKLSVETTNQAINKIIAQQVGAAQANISYNGGNTTVVFAQSKSSGSDIGQDINASAYSDGIMLTLNANKANDIFKDFRTIDRLFSNFTRVFMQDKENYSIAGSYVGDINFLKLSQGATGANEINLKLEENASLIASLYSNGNGKLNLEITQGSKWMIIPTDSSGVSINNLKSSNMILSEDEMQKDTLVQQNTIIDLATSGYATKYGIDKSSHTTLSIAQASNLDNVIFRVYADTTNKQSDIIKVNGVDSSSETKSAFLQAYYTAESLQNAVNYIYQDDENLSVNNTLVATVGSGAKDKFAFDISKPTTVEQGYLLVTTEFIKKTEDKSPITKTSQSANQVDNYYIKGYSAKINPEQSKNSYSMLSVNYLVFLANTNNINKRLGEVRDEAYNHGLWARTYLGQITQNQGIEVTNNYISTQTGYDFGLAINGGMQYIGFAFGYSANELLSSAWKMHSQLLSGALYYSFVKDSGLYTDTIIKYDYIDTKPQVQDLSKNMQSTAISLTQEIGYRAYFDSQNRFFFEAQSEFIGAYMSGSDVLQQYSDKIEAQLHVKTDTSYIFRGRAGGIFGYRLKTSKNQTDFRIGTSYIADYNTATINLEVEKIATDSKSIGFNQMLIANFGINSYLTKNLRLYLEGEMGFIGKTINQNYAANLGLRYSFGTMKREATFGSQAQTQDNIESDFKTLNIEVSNIKCNGCNPESGFYLEVIELPRANAGLNNYLNRYNYRIHTQEDGKAIYFIGPFKNISEAKSKQEEINKVKASLIKSPNANAEIYKINNKAKK